MNIYNLRTKFEDENELGSLIGVKPDKLVSIKVEKDIKNNYIYYNLKDSVKFCNLNSDEDPFSVLFKRGRWYSEGLKKDNFRFNLLSVKPGNYYPRIYRPMLIKNDDGILWGESRKVKKLEKIVYDYPTYYPFDKTVMVSGLNQLTILKGLLKQVLNTIYPSNSNLKTYGHQIKNLLLLSCIEVETQLKGIYKANELKPKRFYSTDDYIKLKDELQLDKYSIELPLYPELKSFEPFKKWDKELGATKSIKWYDDYNAIKHNSEKEYNRATLESAICAICAVVVLLKAQYGDNIPFWREEIGDFFKVSNSVEWLLEDKILPPLNNEWKPNKLGI